jgi:hypothetical protein
MPLDEGGVGLCRFLRQAGVSVSEVGVYGKNPDLLTVVGIVVFVDSLHVSVVPAAWKNFGVRRSLQSRQENHGAEDYD